MRSTFSSVEMFIADLPLLTVFSSEDSSFQNVTTVKLESTLTMNSIFLDIPDIQSVSLPNAFKNVRMKYVSSKLLMYFFFQ